MSCASAGNCAAGGSYTDLGDNLQGFVVSQRNGRWGTAIEVPGLGALNVGQDNIGDAEVTSVSCASAGNCAAGGYYTDSTLEDQGFVAVERDGRWGTAIEVPGLGALNKGGAKGSDAEVSNAAAPPACRATLGGRGLMIMTSVPSVCRRMAAALPMGPLWRQLRSESRCGP